MSKKNKKSIKPKARGGKRKPTQYQKAYRIVRKYYPKRYGDSASRRAAARRLIEGIAQDSKVTVKSVRSAEKTYQDEKGTLIRPPIIDPSFFRTHHYFDVEDLIADIRAMPNTVQIRGRQIFDDESVTYQGGDNIPYGRLKSFVDHIDSIRKENAGDYENDWYIKIRGSLENTALRDTKNKIWYVDILPTDAFGNKQNYGYRPDSDEATGDRTTKPRKPKAKEDFKEPDEPIEPTGEKPADIAPSASETELEIQKSKDAVSKRKTDMLDKLLNLYLDGKISEQMYLKSIEKLD